MQPLREALYEDSDRFSSALAEVDEQLRAGYTRPRAHGRDQASDCTADRSALAALCVCGGGLAVGLNRAGGRA